MTFIRGSKLRTERKTVIDDKEFQQLLDRAAQIKDEFLGLRSSAVLCVLRLTGKRRSEIAMLERDSFKIEKGMLHITFTLLKKRKGTVLTKQSTKSIPLSEPPHKIHHRLSGTPKQPRAYTKIFRSESEIYFWT